MVFIVCRLWSSLVLWLGSLLLAMRAQSSWIFAVGLQLGALTFSEVLWSDSAGAGSCYGSDARDKRVKQ